MKPGDLCMFHCVGTCPVDVYNNAEHVHQRSLSAFSVKTDSVMIVIKNFTVYPIPTQQNISVQFMKTYTTTSLTTIDIHLAYNATKVMFSDGRIGWIESGRLKKVEQ